ncbi:SDR family oxidoreductase [Maritalea porphyrae]|uniref:SDR family oxidoreductase n=1 Tax=Maritalea porphyrae TaxID=880732 RepID=UPI0022AE7EB5|nr:SDR family oxidoreductase [Maritalea porphyrae]MCZ4272933.1 SDR family oxidoreductase [Maritalea porphyrae]
MTKTVVITGANRGIGFELVKCYLANGDWQIIAACRTPQKATALNDLADATDGDIEVVQLDVSSAQSVEAFSKAIGDRPIDILVNNAGVIGGEHQSLGDIDYDEWMETLAINTLGPIRVTEALIENIRKSKNGKIVAISSQLGAMQYQTQGRFAYNSSKAALNRTMTLLANQLRAENIAVAMYHPGWVQTDMGGQAADITPPQSASGLYQCFEKLSLADSGKFFKWNGEPHAW